MSDLPFGLETRPHEKIDDDDPDQTSLYDFEDST